MTARSFIKRLGALLKYKQALRDMNRYADATAEELGREDTCIICREEMRPWDPNARQLERHRPKKLPCGHILHFGCLKSWLERQQVCPTCRSSVVADHPQRGPNFRHRMAFHIAPNVANGQNQAGAAGVQPLGGLQDAPLNGQAGQGGQPQAAARAGMRYINLGPIRLGFAQGGQEVAELANRMGVDLNDGIAQGVPQPNLPAVSPSDLSSMEAVRNRLLEVDQRIQQEVRDIQQGMQNVQTAQHELQLINLMLSELARIRQNQNQGQQQHQPPVQNGQLGQPVLIPTAANTPPVGGIPPPPMMIPQLPFPPPPPPGQLPLPLLPPAPHFAPRLGSPAITRHGAQSNSSLIPSGSPDLPSGVVIPEGWSLLPLQRLDQPVATNGAPTPGPSGVQSSSQDLSHQTDAAPSQPSGPTETIEANNDETPGPSHISSEPVVSIPTPAVEVAAPTPVTPRWGGSAQLFSSANGSSGSLPFGDQHQAEAGGSAEPAAEESEGGTSSSKGKAPAASVEDAEDES